MIGKPSFKNSQTASNNFSGYPSSGPTYSLNTTDQAPLKPLPNYKRIDKYYYNPADPIGKGAFSQVFKAHDELNNHSPAAVKVIPATKLLQNEDIYNLFLREIDILRQIKAENIVQLHDVKRTPNNLYIFMDYCDGGDLDKFLRTRAPLSEETCLIILKQIVNAFMTISSFDIKNSKGSKVAVMHRDIKPANILFHQGKIKIADFGFAKFVEENMKNTRQHHTILGTPLYMPPQILADEPYTTKCDVWSTGILIYQCLYKKLPWTASNLREMLKNIRNIPLEFPKGTLLSKETQDLLSKMLKLKDDDRLDWKSISEHPALRNIKIIPLI